MKTKTVVVRNCHSGDKITWKLTVPKTPNNTDCYKYSKTTEVISANDTTITIPYEYGYSIDLPLFENIDLSSYTISLYDDSNYDNYILSYTSNSKECTYGKLKFPDIKENKIIYYTVESIGYKTINSSFKNTYVTSKTSYIIGETLSLEKESYKKLALVKFLNKTSDCSIQNSSKYTVEDNILYVNECQLGDNISVTILKGNKTSTQIYTITEDVINNGNIEEFDFNNFIVDYTNSVQINDGNNIEYTGGIFSIDIDTDISNVSSSENWIHWSSGKTITIEQNTGELRTCTLTITLIGGYNNVKVIVTQNEYHNESYEGSEDSDGSEGSET